MVLKLQTVEGCGGLDTGTRLLNVPRTREPWWADPSDMRAASHHVYWYRNRS